MALSPQYKQTDIGFIPEDWDALALGDLGDALIGLTYSPSDVSTDGILVLRSSNIQDDALAFDDNVFVTRLVPDKLMARPGDVLICVRNGSVDLIGKAALLDERTTGMTFGAFMAIFRSEIGPLVNYCFQSSIVKKQINEHLGATINQITSKSLNSFKIPVQRNPMEQRAITRALADVDATNVAMNELLAKKRDLRTATMERLLTGEVRLPGFTTRWQEKRIGEVAKVVRGASPRPIADPRWFDSNSSIGWVRISDVSKASMFLRRTTQRLSQDGIARSRKVSAGSVIMSIAATVGRPIITEIDTCIHDGFVVYTKLKLDKFFFFFLLRYLEPLWSSKGQTGSQMNINTAIIEREKIAFPTDLEEQAAIARVLMDSDEEITTLEDRLRKSAALKQAMMQALLTGRARLPVEKAATDAQELADA